MSHDSGAVPVVLPPPVPPSNSHRPVQPDEMNDVFTAMRANAALKAAREASEEDDKRRAEAARNETAMARNSGQEALDDYQGVMAMHALEWVTQFGAKHKSGEALQVAWEQAWQTDGAKAGQEVESRLVAYENAVAKELLLAAEHVDIKPEPRQHAIDEKILEIKSRSSEPRQATDRVFDSLVDALRPAAVSGALVQGGGQVQRFGLPSRLADDTSVFGPAITYPADGSGVMPTHATDPSSAPTHQDGGAAPSLLGIIFGALGGKSLAMRIRRVPFRMGMVAPIGPASERSAPDRPMPMPIGVAPWQASPAVFQKKNRPFLTATAASPIAGPADLKAMLAAIDDTEPPPEPTAAIAARYTVHSRQEVQRIAAEAQSRRQWAALPRKDDAQGARDPAGRVFAATLPAEGATGAAVPPVAFDRKTIPSGTTLIDSQGGAGFAGQAIPTRMPIEPIAVPAIGFETEPARKEQRAFRSDSDLDPDPVLAFNTSHSPALTAPDVPVSPVTAIDPALGRQLWVYRHGDLAALTADARNNRIPIGTNIHVIMSVQPGMLLDRGAILASGHVKAGGEIVWGAKSPELTLGNDIHFVATNLTAEQVRAGMRTGRGLEYALWDGQAGWLSPKRVREVFAIGTAELLFPRILRDAARKAWRPENAWLPPRDHVRVYRGADVEILQTDVARGHIPPGRQVYVIRASDPGAALQNGSMLNVGVVRKAGGAIVWENTTPIIPGDDVLFVVARNEGGSVRARVLSGQGFGEYDVYDGPRGWIRHAEITAAYARGSIGEIFGPSRTPGASPAPWTPSAAADETPDAYLTYYRPDARRAEAAVRSAGPEQLHYLRPPLSMRDTVAVGETAFRPNGSKERKLSDALADTFGAKIARRIRYTEESYAAFYARASGEMRAELPKPGSFRPHEVSLMVAEMPGGLEMFVADVAADGEDRDSTSGSLVDLLTKTGDNSRILLGSRLQSAGREKTGEADAETERMLDLQFIGGFNRLVERNPQVAAKADLSLADLDFSGAGLQNPVERATAMILASRGRACFAGEIVVGGDQRRSKGWVIGDARFQEFLAFARESGIGLLLNGRNPDELMEVFGQERFRDLNVVFAHTGIGRMAGPDEPMITQDIRIVRRHGKNSRIGTIESRTLTAPGQLHMLYRLLERVPNARVDISWGEVVAACSGNPGLRESLVTFIIDNQDRLMSSGLGELPGTGPETGGVSIFADIARRDPNAPWKLLRGNYEEVMQSAEQGVYDWTCEALLERGATGEILKAKEIRESLTRHRADLLEGAWQEYRDWLDDLAEGSRPEAHALPMRA